MSELNWDLYHQSNHTRPGGKISRGDGTFVDANGNSLEPAEQRKKIEEMRKILDAQIADLERQEADARKADKVNEEAAMPTAVDKPVAVPEDKMTTTEVDPDKVTIPGTKKEK